MMGSGKGRLGRKEEDAEGFYPVLVLSGDQQTSWDDVG